MAGLKKYRPSEWMNRVTTSEGQLSWPLLAHPWGINAGPDNFSPCSRILWQWPFLWISLAPAQARMHDIFLLAAVVWSALCRRWGRDLSGIYLRDNRCETQFICFHQRERKKEQLCGYFSAKCKWAPQGQRLHLSTSWYKILSLLGDLFRPQQGSKGLPE